MNIQYLTLTGADDSIDPVELVKLSKQYPYIEWAILISAEREGTSRFPTRQWRHEFHKLSQYTNKSAHLCGREVLTRLSEEDGELGIEMKDYQRIQLNFNAKHTSEQLLGKLIQATTSGFYTQHSGQRIKFITQYNQPNQDITTRFIDAHRLQPDAHHILFDASGGLGRTPESWPTPISNKLCGYAGGLGPSNIEQELININFLIRQQVNQGDKRLWLDMENNLRTNEAFDLNKVIEVAEKVHAWMAVHNKAEIQPCAS